MYGKISQLLAHPGQRVLLAHRLLWATRNIPGCHSYTIELDLNNPDLIWTHELWDSQEARMAFTSQASNQTTWKEAQSLIADIDNLAETTPHSGD